MTTDSPDASLHLPDYVRGLLDPRAYPAPPSRVDLVQTHISYVFLADDVVYKTKKPVDFGFITQLDAATRERYCRDEVRLNRRLSHGVYLDTVPVVRLEDGRHVIDPPTGVPAGGAVVEWAVKMRRLPDEAMLASMLASGPLPEGYLQRVVRRLIAFHESAAVVKNDRAFAGASGVQAWWAREYGEAEGFIGDTWLEADARVLREFAHAALTAHAALLDQRLEEGRVVEGHGDLHAKHIYALGPEVDDLQIVDCIEFTDWFNFRYLDVGYDIAFLAMDLEARGFPDLADEFAGRYLAASGDETLGVLQPLHRAFRAFVRGKVESIGAHAPEISAEQRADLARSAAAYFRLAADFARRQAGPALILMSGLSGTGKSVVGATLAARIGAAYVSSDAVRKRLAGLDPRTPVPGRYREGMYQADSTERTYEMLRAHAAIHLAAGRPVVLDATHQRAADRRAAIEVARAAGKPALIVELRADEATVRRRLEARAGDPLRTSDATFEIYQQQQRAFEPIAPSEASHLVLDASLAPETLARDVAARLASA
ncbi:MAG: AAA family ATPase [Dehalococcoidia bacterium]|nr:AAA family ATPase [Dehalococcoidia bacterium]